MTAPPAEPPPPRQPYQHPPGYQPPVDPATGKRIAGNVFRISGSDPETVPVKWFMDQPLSEVSELSSYLLLVDSRVVSSHQTPNDLDLDTYGPVTCIRRVAPTVPAPAPFPMAAPPTRAVSDDIPVNITLPAVRVDSGGDLDEDAASEGGKEHDGDGVDDDGDVVEVPEGKHEDVGEYGEFGEPDGLDNYGEQNESGSGGEEETKGDHDSDNDMV